MEYKQCNRCVMDNVVDIDITFNNLGLCHHCQRIDNISSSRQIQGKKGDEALQKLVKKIKNAGKNSEYDCIIGVSGGVDSTYVAYLVKEHGLRPLAIHLDNGWDTEIAVRNIEHTLKALNINLFTHVMDWNEFKGLQVAFLKSSTPDGEIPTDHAIFALMWQQAAKRNIKYIISGMNFSTEALDVSSWSYGHSDWRYIKYINQKFNKKLLKNYPHFSFIYLFYVNFIKKIKSASILNYVDYNKDIAKKIIESKLRWVDYGGKHYESVYTRFYHGYFLPTKFNIDKRYGHFSSLINAGKISKDEAISELKTSIYSEKLQKLDKQYVCKKLNLSSDDFGVIIQNKRKSFKDYKSSYAFIQFLRRLVRFLRSKKLYPM